MYTSICFFVCLTSNICVCLFEYPNYLEPSFGPNPKLVDLICISAKLELIMSISLQLEAIFNIFHRTLKKAILKVLAGSHKSGFSAI